MDRNKAYQAFLLAEDNNTQSKYKNFVLLFWFCYCNLFILYIVVVVS